MTTLQRLLPTVFLLLAAIPSLALEVIPVPADPEDPYQPLPAYGGKPALLAAVVRSGPATVYFRCDADGDGVWDQDPLNVGNHVGNSWYRTTTADVAFHAYYPAGSGNRLYQAVLQVAENTGGGGSYYVGIPVFVLADMPDPATDPDWADNADAEQLVIQRRAALRETLWFLHTRLNRVGSGSNQMTGWLDASANYARLANSATYLSALLAAGYLPAYPPGTYEQLGVAPPQNFLAENDQRWNTSPYAEDAVRLLNYLLTNLYSLSVPSADESDDGGTGLNGTNDGAGWTIYGTLFEYAPANPLALAALADCGLAGTVAQTGTLARGRTLEAVVQQMVDFVVAAQFDENSGVQGVGAWGYGLCNDCGFSGSSAMGQQFGWSVYALHRAESAMGAAGVYVNHRLKNRLPNMLYYNPYTDGGPRYHNAANNSFFEATGHLLLACRWLGWHQWEADDMSTVSYPMLSLSRGQARQIHDRFLTYAASRWTTAGSGILGSYYTVLWNDGDYASGLRGHSLFMPMLTTLNGLQGTGVALPGIDWSRQFAVDLVFQQKSGSTWYPNYTASHYTSTYLGSDGLTAQAALIMAALGPLRDTTPPDAPETFAVDYSAGGNTLSWSGVDGIDLAGYRLYRGDTQPVPLDTAHLLAETGQNSYLDSPAGWDVCYRVVAVDFSGNTSDPVEPTALSDAPDQAPDAVTALLGAVPNPFNPRTRIAFSLAEGSPVSLDVFDLGGRHVVSLLAEAPLAAGRHHRDWDGKRTDGSPAPAGVYLYRLRAGDFQASGRVTLLK